MNRTPGIDHLGGATLDNEENYLIKKLFGALATRLAIFQAGERSPVIPVRRSRGSARAWVPPS